VKINTDVTKERYIKELKRFAITGKTLDQYINEDVKDRKQLSKLNCALKITNTLEELKNLKIDGKNEALKRIKEMFKKKEKPRYIKRPEEQLKIRNTESSINRLKNKRLKIALRLEEISGLRVSEIEKLSKKDICIESLSQRMVIRVSEGKGNKERYVKCLPDNWVLKNIINLQERKNGKLFYSANYTMAQARQRCDIHTHDLRKVFANVKIDNNVSSNRKEELQDDLGHIHKSKTYKKYIGRDINDNNTKWSQLEPLEHERKVILSNGEMEDLKYCFD